MTREIKAGVLLSLKDAFSRGIGAAGNSVKDFGGKAQGVFGKVNNALSGIAGRLGAIGVTLSAGYAVKSWIDMENRLIRIATDIGLTAEETDKLKRNIYAVAQSTDIKMDTAPLVEAVEVLGSMSIEADYINGNLRTMGLLMKATGVSGQEAGDLFAYFYRQGKAPEEILSTLNDIVEIGDRMKGGFSLSRFTQALPRLSEANAIMDEGALNARELFTALQVLGKGTEDAGRAEKAFLAMTQELLDPDKQKALYSLGVELHEKSTGQFRKFDEIMRDIAETTTKRYGNINILRELFSGAAFDAVFAYEKVGDLAREVEDLGDTSGAVQNRAERNASSLASSLQNLQTSFKAISDSALTGPLENLNRLLQELAKYPKVIEAGIYGVTAAFAGLGLIKIGSGVMSFVKFLSGFRKGKVDLDVAIGNSAGAGIPVYVTNWGGAGGSPGLPDFMPPKIDISGAAKAVPGALAGLGIPLALAGVFLLPFIFHEELKEFSDAATPTLRKVSEALSLDGKGHMGGGGLWEEMYGSSYEVPANPAEKTTSVPSLAGSMNDRGNKSGGGLREEMYGSGYESPQNPAERTISVPSLAGSMNDRGNKSAGGLWEEMYGSGYEIPADLAEEAASVPSLSEGSSGPAPAGSAEIITRVDVYNNRVEAKTSVGKNDTNFKFDTGHVREVQGF
jgi:TP901 family phage tail tape measure protein